MSDGGDDSSGRVGLVGKTLGRYRITAELGRGGMATVYRAFDPQLGRDVAVKVMHGSFTGRGDIEKRFRREAQAVAAIKHDSIVDIFDFAPGGDGEPGYIVSELIQGPTLRELLNRCGGKIVPEVAAVLACRVAAALGAAHRHGIIHRDVKPDNVMVDCRAGAPVRVLLTDFGVARILEDDTMTATGSILGSPSYMSPEQARGRDMDKSSDVFSLGGLLYHLVTGRAPFPGKDPLAVIAAILTGEIPRPSQIEPHVGPQLEAVIMRCLKRASADRYPDGGAVQAALREIVQDSPLAGDDPLRRFFDDGEAFLRELSARVAAQAFDSARACVRRGELGRALGEVNRVFAYQPRHAGAEALLARITARRRWGTIARVAVAAAALGAGGVAAGKLALSRRAETGGAPATMVVVTAAASGKRVPAPATPAIGIAVPAVAPSAAAAVPVGAAAEPSSAPQPPAPVEMRKTPRPPERTRHPSGSKRLVAAVTNKATAAGGVTLAVDDESIKSRPTVEATGNRPATATAVAAVAQPSVSPAETSPPAASTAAAPATASLVIRASQGFCSPSLDQQPAKVSPVYEGIAAGPHQIFCTLPGGDKRLAGVYDLRPGTRPNLVVVPGPDGQPVLARPE